MLFSTLVRASLYEYVDVVVDSEPGAHSGTQFFTGLTCSGYEKAHLLAKATAHFVDVEGWLVTCLL